MPTPSSWRLAASWPCTTRRSRGRLAIELLGFDRGDHAVLAFGREQHDVGVQLRVGDSVLVLVLTQAAGRVDDLRGEQAFGLFEALHFVRLAPDASDLSLDPLHGALHGLAVSGLDLGTAVGVGGRP